jgi:hypothetical protein
MNVESIIGGGFRLIRQRPAAVAVWGFLYMLAVIGMSFLMRPFLTAQMQMIGGGSSAGDPEAALAHIGAMVGRMLLFALLFLILYVILFAASQRAVLQPERQGFFYLRLGMDELRLLALTVIFFVAFYAGLMVVTILMSLVMGILAAATHSVGTVGVILVFEFVAIIAFMIWFWTRFALAFPLTLMREKIIIGESWRITRGRFWTLFAAFLVIFLITLLLWSAASVVTSGSYFAQLARSAGDPAAIREAAQQQMARQFGQISVTMVIGWILSAAAGAIGIALWGGAAATAARALTFNRDQIADTFA